jgi:hypothetical protein
VVELGCRARGVRCSGSSASRWFLDGDDNSSCCWIGGAVLCIPGDKSAEEERMA